MIDILYLAHWTESENDYAPMEIQSPTMDDLVTAIDKLNGEDYNDLYLQKDANNEDHWLCIGGGTDGQYVITGTTRPDAFPTVVEKSRTLDATMIPLMVGGQGAEFPTAWVHDKEIALVAAEYYLKKGKFSPELNWENQ